MDFNFKISDYISYRYAHSEYTGKIVAIKGEDILVQFLENISPWEKGDILRIKNDSWYNPININHLVLSISEIKPPTKKWYQFWR